MNIQEQSRKIPLTEIFTTTGKKKRPEGAPRVEICADKKVWVFDAEGNEISFPDSFRYNLGKRAESAFKTIDENFHTLSKEREFREKFFATVTRTVTYRHDLEEPEVMVTLGVFCDNNTKTPYISRSFIEVEKNEDLILQYICELFDNLFRSYN